MEPQVGTLHAIDRMQYTGRREQHAIRFLVLAALLVAATLRWADLRLVEFKYDEAHIIGQALDLARGGTWPLLSGGTTLGIPRGTLFRFMYICWRCRSK